MWKQTTFFVFHSTSVYFLYHHYHWEILSIPLVSIGTLGTALAILYAFRFRVSYERWWEARTLWGNMINYSRIFTRQISTFSSAKGSVEKSREEIIRLLLAFIHSLKLHLLHIQRKNGKLEPSIGDHPDLEQISPYLGPSEREKLGHGHHLPAMLLQLLGERLQILRENGDMIPLDYIQVDNTLAGLTLNLGGLERIRWTPVPEHYGFYMRALLYLFILLLPLAFIKQMTWLTIPFTCINYMTFHSLDIIGQRAETPFGFRSTDISLVQYAEALEENLQDQWKLSAAFRNEKRF